MNTVNLRNNQLSGFIPDSWLTFIGSTGAVYLDNNQLANRFPASFFINDTASAFPGGVALGANQLRMT